MSQGLSGVRQAGSFASPPLSEARAVCVNALVRICAGGELSGIHLSGRPRAASALLRRYSEFLQASTALSSTGTPFIGQDSTTPTVR